MKPKICYRTGKKLVISTFHTDENKTFDQICVLRRKKPFEWKNDDNKVEKNIDYCSNEIRTSQKKLFL